MADDKDPIEPEVVNPDAARPARRPRTAESVAEDVRRNLASDARMQRVFRRVGEQKITAEVADILRRQDVYGVEAGMTVYEALVRAVYACALNGNHQAMKLIMDRVVPVTARLEVGPLAPGASQLTDEELDAEIRRLESGSRNGDAHA